MSTHSRGERRSASILFLLGRPNLHAQGAKAYTFDEKIVSRQQTPNSQTTGVGPVLRNVTKHFGRRRRDVFFCFREVIARVAIVLFSQYFFRTVLVSVPTASWIGHYVMNT